MTRHSLNSQFVVMHMNGAKAVRTLARQELLRRNTRSLFTRAQTLITL